MSQTLVLVDFLDVPTATLRVLYVFVVLLQGRRKGRPLQRDRLPVAAVGVRDIAAPYAGSGAVVADDLVITSRQVALLLTGAQAPGFRPRPAPPCFGVRVAQTNRENERLMEPDTVRSTVNG